MNVTRIAFLLAAVAGAPILLSSAPATNLPSATHVLKESGVPAGLAVVVGTTDGALEAALTNGGKMLVQGLALSDEAAARARKQIFEKKLYGLASVARVETATTLPYYDRIVNLLVADLDSLGKDAPPKEEIDRILGYEGVAYLKKAGNWAKTVKPTPKEVDNWGHYFCDASRNSVSKDLLVGPPNAVRWLGGPTGRNPIGGPRTSDGVFVQISNPYARPLGKAQGNSTTVPWAPVDSVAIWAKDVNSGVMLWYRVLSRLPVVNAGSTRWTSYAVDFAETFVAAGGRVYVYDFTNDEQVALTALKLRSGAVERVFDRSVVFRKAEAPAMSKDAKGRDRDWRTTAHATFANTTVAVHDGKVVQALWNKVFVMDAASGDVIWKKEAPAGSNFAKVMVSGDRLIVLLVEPMKERFFISNNHPPYVAVEAWQLRDGKPAWRYADLKGYGLIEDRRICFGYGSSGHHLIIPLEPVKREPGKNRMILLLDTRDGAKVWEKGIGMPFTWAAIIGNQVWDCGSEGANCRDLATGNGLGSGGIGTGNCSIGCGTPNYFIHKKVFFPVAQVAQAGTLGKGRLPFYYLRPITQTCGEMLCPSYGSVYNMPPVCRCEQALAGTQAWYALVPTTAVPDGARLLKHAAEPLGAVERQAETLKFPGAFDWGMPANLQGQGPFWRWPARGVTKGCAIWHGYGLAQTPPVEAGGLALAAHVQEHRLAATRGGKEVWNFVAGGRIGSAPVIHDGKAIFGSHDGYVYAVNVKDGTLAWRFLGAPADRRHVVMNQVESVWPVFGVVLHEGKLYFSAGKHAELDSGVHFYCLDPASGKMMWHVKWVSGLSSDKYTPRKLITLRSPMPELGIPAGQFYDVERNKRIINDVVAVRDGKVWLFETPVVDLADPKDTIINPETLMPPGVGAAGKSP